MSETPVTWRQERNLDSVGLAAGSTIHQTRKRFPYSHGLREFIEPPRVCVDLMVDLDSVYLGMGVLAPVKRWKKLERQIKPERH